MHTYTYAAIYVASVKALLWLPSHNHSCPLHRPLHPLIISSYILNHFLLHLSGFAFLFPLPPSLRYFNSLFFHLSSPFSFLLHLLYCLLFYSSFCLHVHLTYHVFFTSSIFLLFLYSLHFHFLFHPSSNPSPVPFSIIRSISCFLLLPLSLHSSPVLCLSLHLSSSFTFISSFFTCSLSLPSPFLYTCFLSAPEHPTLTFPLPPSLFGKATGKLFYRER